MYKRLCFSTMTQYPLRSRRFAPLREVADGQHHDLPKLHGVIFDVDGTLCLPQNHMFSEMRTALSIPKHIDILEHISSLPTPSQQDSAMAAVRAIEQRTMTSQVAQPGLVDLMAYLDARGIRKGICTRNFDTPVSHLLGKFLRGHVFDPIVTRDFRPPKPDPAGLLYIARSWGLARAVEGPGDEGEVWEVLGEESSDSTPREKEGAVGRRGGEISEVGDASGVIMVGDSIDDMTAGRRAGAATVLLVNEANAHLAEHEHTDMVIERLDDLIQVLDHGFVGRELPHDP
ncbi:HAD-like protein [Daldinia bambusicola]|nr:HAD-like protein [Daldinia bambusicola]